MSKKARTEALRALLDASMGRNFEAGLVGETSRWADPSYRRSGEAAAALDPQTGVRFSPEAVGRLEDGVAALRSLDGPRRNWDEADLWAIVASLVATLPPDLKPSRLQVELSRRLGLVEDPGPGVVGFVLKGVTWTGSPRTIHDVVLGRAGKDYRTELELRAARRPTPLPDRKKGWLARVFPEGRSDEQAPVVACTWVSASHGQAVRDARRRFLDVLDTSLLFREEVEPELEAALRGVAARVIDMDPAAPLVARDRFGAAQLAEWSEPAPLQLDRVLELGVSHALVDPVLNEPSRLAWRARMTARMHGRALRCEDPAEAILALWSGFDALLGDGSSAPDKAISNRFAVLHAGRQGVEEGYGWLVGHMREVKAASAHGHHCSRLEDHGFVREAAAQLRWATNRLWALLVQAGTTRDDDYGTLFRELKAKLAGR
jgi:hypothetical protein